jgi:hypothetical protein
VAIGRSATTISSGAPKEMERMATAARATVQEARLSTLTSTSAS